MSIKEVTLKAKNGYLSFDGLKKQPVPILNKLVAWYKGIGDWNVGFIENNKLYVGDLIDGAPYRVLYATDEEESKTEFEEIVNGQLFVAQDMGNGCTIYTYCPNVSTTKDGRIIIDKGGPK